MINLTYSEAVFLLELLEDFEAEDYSSYLEEDLKNALELLRAHIIKEEDDGRVQKFQRRKEES